ncbi:MAG: cellulase family glycosylhydrolase [Clostridia bacterium]|nr:cellulase family glycosylhydrolase [Clostridia bacterium]
MKRFIGFEHGMGIGGWLTNYKRFNVLPRERQLCLTVGDMEHFATYITEEDIRYIAGLGMDHIRLGFDQIVFEESPYVYREEIFEHIDRFILWCKKYHLNIVLNMHKAVGNYCDIKEDVELLEDEELQNRFIALWIAFEKRYENDNSIAFELLNEVRNVDPQKWNLLAERAINELRKINKTRKIIIGSTCWNSPDTLKDLKIYDDENIIYTFHIYSPHEFTHQRGVLQASQIFYNRIMPYPGDIERYRDFQAVVHHKPVSYMGYDRMDIAYMRDVLKAAVDFTKQNPDKILWCGEFGTIRHADIKWRENWMRDVITILKENDIPYCVWNYLSTPNDGNRFSLVDDDHRKILSEELAKIIRGEIDVKQAE